MKTQIDESRFTSEMKPEIKRLLEILGYDGHTIYRASVLNGLSVPLIARLCTVELSGEGKFKIYDNHGNPVTSLRGVYGLTVLGCICVDLDLKYESMNGRGFQARAYSNAIAKFLSL